MCGLIRQDVRPPRYSGGLAKAQIGTEVLQIKDLRLDVIVLAPTVISVYHFLVLLEGV